MEKLSKLLRDLLSSHPIKCSYILYFYLGESLSLKKLHCTHKLMINYCTKFWQSKKVMCNFPMNSGGTGLDTSGAITQFGTTFESSSGLEVRETSRRRGVKLPSSYLSRIFDSITMHREAASPQGGLL